MPSFSKEGSSETQGLSPDSLTVHRPYFALPKLRQHHVLTASDLITAPPASLSTPESTPLERGFELRLTRIIWDSPRQRTHTRAELLAIGRDEFDLSQRRAAAIRERVIHQVGAKAWCSAGAPRGRRRST